MVAQSARKQPRPGSAVHKGAALKAGGAFGLDWYSGVDHGLAQIAQDSVARQAGWLEWVSNTRL